MSTALDSTAAPGATSTCVTTPSRGERSSFSIFMASTTTTGWRAATRSPTPTSTRTIRPGIGALTGTAPVGADVPTAPVAPLAPVAPVSPLRGNRLVQRSADFHANRAGFLAGMKANFPDHAGVHERQRVGIDPRRVNDASLAFDRHGELPWLAGRLDRDFQGPAVHHDIDVHRNASNRARCAQRDSAGDGLVA